MSIKLHNTLSKKLEEFEPLVSGEVRMYNCGPTVYDYVHVGNLRAFLTADLLRRTFEHSGLKVTQVTNITDVGIGGDNDEGEDKIIKGLKREGKPVSMESMKELADFYTDRFLEDIAELNILRPHILPKASEHIDIQIALIKKLEEKGFAYQTSDGVYFDTAKDPHYGKLGGLAKESAAEARIEANVEKRSARDFALWKFNPNLGWPSLWGQGFPGWHIECSAMSQKYLGESFDIHTGGIDLASIHHNNEIAQSENACGCELARFWVHNEFINISGDKMAKSEGNIVTLRFLKEKGLNPLAYRYFLLLAHYRTPTNFTLEALEAAENAYKRLKELFTALPEGGQTDRSYMGKFEEAIYSDLNTPGALAVVWNLVKDESVSPADKRATLLEFDTVLGLNLEKNEYLNVPEDIVALGKERDTARTAGNFEEADRIRKEIESQGYEIRDVGGTFVIFRA